MAQWHEINMDTDPRGEQFGYFSGMFYPFSTVTVPVDITRWSIRIRQAGRPFFLSLLYEILRAGNAVPEMRRRILDGRVIEFERCFASYTVATPDGNYRYCNVEDGMPVDEFIAIGKEKQQLAVREERLTEAEDPLRAFFITCLPWFRCTSMVMPVPDAAFSVPNIAVGKRYTENRPVMTEGGIALEEHVMLPITLQTHHALVDGIHMAAFFDELDKMNGTGENEV